MKLPPEYKQGIGPRGNDGKRGADEEAVAGQTSSLVRTFMDAQRQSEGLSGTKRSGVFDPLVDQVLSYAREAKDTSTPTVLAPMASALLGLDDRVRDEVLARAGNPEVFQRLRGKPAMARHSATVKPGKGAITKVSPLKNLTDK